MMDREVPCAGAAHREAGDDDAVRIYRILGADGVHGFEDIHFAGELRRVAEPAIGMQDDGVAKNELAGGSFAFGEKGKFGAFFVPASEPDFEAVGGWMRRRPPLPGPLLQRRGGEAGAGWSGGSG